jgi:hypothetical protein
MDKIGRTRNDINHAGWTSDTRTPVRIKKNLKNYLEEAEELIRTNYKNKHR